MLKFEIIQIQVFKYLLTLSAFKLIEITNTALQIITYNWIYRNFITKLKT